MDSWDSHHVRNILFYFVNLCEISYFILILAFSHPGTTISRIRQNSLTPKDHMNKDGHGGSSGATGSSLLDTYLQMITENAFGKYNLNMKHTI